MVTDQGGAKGQGDRPPLVRTADTAVEPVHSDLTRTVEKDNLEFACPSCS